MSAITDLSDSDLQRTINDYYQQFGGRAAAANELAAWTAGLRNQGATFDTLKKAVIDDAGLGRTYLPSAISAVYQQYGGRAAAGNEVVAWTDTLRNQGATFDTLRKAVASDGALGQAYLPSAISSIYQQYGGRVAATYETSFWSGAIRAGSATLDTIRTAIANDQLGGNYLPGAISGVYQQYGGRAAAASEASFWLGAIRTGSATLDTVRTAIANDQLGAGYLPGAIDATYQQYGGRGASAYEISAWMGAVRTGAVSLDKVRAAIASDQLGANYLPGAISSVYQQYGGRAAAASETSFWLGAIRGGSSTLDTIRTAIANDQLGANYLPGAISATYQQYGGRAASASEISAWLGAIRTGGSALDTVRIAVVDDQLGQNYLRPGIASRYQEFGGRAPTSAEMNAWMASIHNGAADLSAVKLAILNDPLGAGFAASQLAAYYSAAGKTAPSESEVQSLLAMLRGGTAYADAEASLAQAHAGTLAPPPPPTPPAPAVDPIETAIYEAYGNYIGRAPTAAEVDQWMHGLTSLSTAAAQLRASLLPSTDGQAHLAAQITAEFQQWGSRAPTSTELATWKTAIQDNGAVPDAIRISILGTSLGQPKASGAITAEYQEYLGRAPTAAELQASLATLATTHDYAAAHQAVFTAPDSILRFYDTLHTLYTSLLGHDYTSTDQSKWFDQIFFKNATYATMRATLMIDPTSVGAHLAGTSAADTITIHGATGETTISNFNATVDKVKLDTAVYGGTNLLDATHARELMSTDGVTPNVLITLDATDHILLHGVNLAELSASNFLFG